MARGRRHEQAAGCLPPGDTRRLEAMSAGGETSARSENFRSLSTMPPRARRGRVRDSRAGCVRPDARNRATVVRNTRGRHRPQARRDLRRGARRAVRVLHGLPPALPLDRLDAAVQGRRVRDAARCRTSSAGSGSRPRPSSRRSPACSSTKALFTAREAAAGFVIGAIVGIAIGVVFHFSNLMRRGFQPYVVGSQTVPILAIAPMVVIWLGGKGLPVWMPVAVISAFLTFFPVAINTLRGLDSTDPRKLELMRSYAASEWSTLWRVKFPCALPYCSRRSRWPRRRASSARSSASCRRRSRTASAARFSTSPSTTRSIPRRSGRRTSSRPPSASSSSAIVAIAERLVVRRAPENVA